MGVVRVFLVIVVMLLALAVFADLSAITFGRFTADVYYLPLREVPLGEHRDAVEDILIGTHGQVIRYQRRLWLVIHGSALVCAVLALISTWWARRHQDGQ